MPLRCWDSHVLVRFAESPELHVSSERAWLSWGGDGGESRIPFLARVRFPLWVERGWASLTVSLLGHQMPVAKRPRKSSSDLDQGSPSLTEEENSETSSESEKNSDQVRRFGAALAWRLAGWCGLREERRRLGGQWH